MEKILCPLGVYDQETQRKLSEYQQAILDLGFTGRQTMGIPFHVTLGTFGPERREALDAALKGLRQGPVDVWFNHIGMFEGQQVLFLSPDVDRELLELKEAFNDERGWTAHTTMLIDHRENVLQAARVLGEKFKRFTGRIERVELYEFFPAELLAERAL